MRKNRTMSTPRAGPRLLPHERWFADAVARRQQAHPTEQYLRYKWKYGPDGTTLLLAGQMTGLVCGVLILVSIGLLPISQYISHWFLASGFAVAAVSAIRLAQGARAARKFGRARQSSRGS
jgi:hypothetical protein